MLLALFLMTLVLNGFLPNQAHVIIKRQALIVDEDAPLATENEINTVEETNKDTSLRTPQKYIIEPIQTVGRTNEEQHFAYDKVNFDDSNGEQQTKVETEVIATENYSTTEIPKLTQDNVAAADEISAHDDSRTQVASQGITNAKQEEGNNMEAQVLSAQEVVIESETSALQNSFPVATENVNNENVVKQFQRQAQLDTIDTQTTTTTTTGVVDSVISNNRPTNNDNKLENDIVTLPITTETFSTTTPAQSEGINPVTQLINDDSKEATTAATIATQVTEATNAITEDTSKIENIVTSNEPITTNISPNTNAAIATTSPTLISTTTPKTIKVVNENISTLSQPNIIPTAAAFRPVPTIKPTKQTVRPNRPIKVTNADSRPRPRPTANTGTTIKQTTTTNNQVNSTTTTQRPTKPWFSFLLPSVQPLFFNQFNFTLPNRTHTHPQTLFGVGLFALPWNYTNVFSAWNFTLFPSLHGTANEARHGFLYANQTYYKHAKYNTTNLTAPILQIFFPLKYAQIQQQILNQQNVNQIVVRRPLRRPVVQQQRFVNSDADTGITNKNDNVNVNGFENESEADVDVVETIDTVEGVEDTTSNSNYLRSAVPELPKTETKKTSVIFEFEIPNSINQFINTIFGAFAN